MPTNYKKCLICQQQDPIEGSMLCVACSYAQEHHTTPIVRKHSDIIAGSLRDFGYEVSDDFVWNVVLELLRGEPPKGIIGMMAQSQLREAGMFI